MKKFWIILDIVMIPVALFASYLNFNDGDYLIGGIMVAIAISFAVSAWIKIKGNKQK